MWKVTNTANDRSKADLHRIAHKFTYEPSIGGMRLRLGESMEIDDEQFENLRNTLEGWKAKGMVDFEQVRVDAKPQVSVPPPVAPVVVAVPAQPVVVAQEPVPEVRKSQGKKKPLF